MLRTVWADEHSRMRNDADAAELYESSAALARRAQGLARRHGVTHLRRRAELFEAVALARCGPAGPVIETLQGLSSASWVPTAHLAVLQVAMSRACLRNDDRDGALQWAHSAVAQMHDKVGSPASIQAHEALAAALPPSDHSAELLSYAFAIADSQWRDRLQLLDAARVSLDYERIAAQVRRADELARSDPLTGVGNRRALEETIGGWSNDPTGPRTAAVLLADIDGLKGVNDRFGHAAGDRAITAIAGHLREQCGPRAVIVRWGGDEFVVVLPGVAEDDARLLVGRMTTGVQTEDAVPMTVSIGVAAGSLSDIDAIMGAADADMYRHRTRARRVAATDAGTPGAATAG